MRFLKLLLFGLLVVLMLVPSTASVMAQYPGEPTGEPPGGAEGGRSSGGAPPEHEQLLMYAEAFARGLVLRYTMTVGFSGLEDAGSLDGLDGMAWALDGVGEDGDSTFEFTLSLQDDLLVLLYDMGETGDDEETGGPVEVYLNILADNAYTDEEVVDIAVLNKNLSGGLVKANGKIADADETAESSLRAKVIRIIDVNQIETLPIIVNIPVNFLILFEDYAKALEDARTPAATPDPGDGDQDGDGTGDADAQDEEEEPGDVPESDRLLRGLLEELNLSKEMKKHEGDEGARLILDVTYDEKTKEWSLDKDSDAEVVPPGFEAMDTSNRTLIVIGVIAVMVVCFVALGMSVLLILKRARR